MTATNGLGQCVFPRPFFCVSSDLWTSSLWMSGIVCCVYSKGPRGVLLPPLSAPRALLFWLPKAESCCLLDTLWPTTTATWLIIFALNALDSTPRTRHTPTLGPSTFFFRLVHNLLRLRSRTATTCAKRSLGSTMWHSYAHNASTVWFLALPHIFYGALLSGGHIKT